MKIIYMLHNGAPGIPYSQMWQLFDSEDACETEALKLGWKGCFTNNKPGWATAYQRDGVDLKIIPIEYEGAFEKFEGDLLFAVRPKRAAVRQPHGHRTEVIYDKQGVLGALRHRNPESFDVVPLRIIEEEAVPAVEFIQREEK